MPRDWKNDPKAIREHCTCVWTRVRVRSALPIYIDGAPWWRTDWDEDCPLHGDNPDHNVPEDW